MVCPACNANIRDGSTTCTKCGEILVGEASPTKSFDIEHELKDMAESISDLPDDSNEMADKRLLHVVLEFSLLFLVVGVAVIGLVGFNNGWFAPENVVFSHDDFVMDADVTAWVPTDSVSGEAVAAVSAPVGRAYLKERVLQDGVSLAWLSGEVLEQRIGGNVVWTLPGDRDNILEFVNKQKTKDAGSFMKHRIAQFPLQRFFRAGFTDGYMTVLGDYLLVSDSVKSLRKAVSVAEHGGTVTALHTKIDTLFGTDFDLRFIGGGDLIAALLGTRFDFFGSSESTGLSVVSEDAQATFDFYTLPSVDGTGMLNRITAHSSSLLRYTPALPDMSLVLSAAHLKGAYVEILSAYNLEKLPFEDWLLDTLDLSFRDDVLGLTTEESLVLLSRGRDGDFAPSLTVLSLLDEEGAILQRLDRIQAQLELYFGIDASNDFVLVDDSETGQLKWRAIRLATKLSEVDYKGTIIRTRYLGKMLGYNVGLYVAQVGDVLIMSTDSSTAKQMIDYVKNDNRTVTPSVADTFADVFDVRNEGGVVVEDGVVTKKEPVDVNDSRHLVHAYFNGSYFTDIFPMVDVYGLDTVIFDAAFEGAAIQGEVKVKVGE